MMGTAVSPERGAPPAPELATGLDDIAQSLRELRSWASYPSFSSLARGVAAVRRRRGVPRLRGHPRAGDGLRLLPGRTVPRRRRPRGGHRRGAGPGPLPAVPLAAYGDWPWVDRAQVRELELEPATARAREILAAERANLVGWAAIGRQHPARASARALSSGRARRGKGRHAQRHRLPGQLNR